ncbi:MAG: DNA/RNA nuclease SfsA [Xanthobacteraceae bacterium]
MRFPAPLMRATLIRRYKRFLADVALADGSVETVHVANPGAMPGLAVPGATIWLSRSANPARKLPLSWELVEVELGAGPELVVVNTAHANALAAEALASGAMAELAGYATARREVKYGTRSRIDFLLEEPGRPPCYVEVKAVTLMRRPGPAEFPDAVTARGARHLDELRAMAAAGHRAVMLFLVQIASADRLTLARDIDPRYGQAFDRALAAGVEAIAYRCTVSCEQIAVADRVPVMEQAGPPS